MRVGEARNPGPNQNSSKGVPWSRKRPQRTLLDSNSDAPLIASGRFGPFSSEDQESVNANRAPTELLEVITVPQSVPARPARLRLLKRMSQATTEVARSGGDREVPQEVSRRQGTWVEMTVEDSDNDEEERDPDIRVFDPVESDDGADCVLDALQRDLEVDVASACSAVADAPHFGRVAVVARGDIRPATVSPTPRTTQLEGERVRLPVGGQQQLPHWRTRQIRLNQVSCSMEALSVSGEEPRRARFRE